MERGAKVFRTQFVAFHNFRGREEVKMQKVSYAVQAAISFRFSAPLRSLCSAPLVAFITHAKNVRVGKQCNGGRGKGRRGHWVRVVFAVCGVCLKFMTV